MGMGNGKGELLEMLLAGGSFPAPKARGAEAQSICQQSGLACSCLHFDPGLHYRSARGPTQKDQEAQLLLHRPNLEQVADRLYERGEKLEHGMNKIVSNTPI